MMSHFDYFLHLSPMGTYGLLLALLITGALGFPPEDATVILAGILANRGQGDLIVIALICYFGAIIGDCIIFFAGRWFGATLFQKPWFQSRVPPGKISKIRKSLEKRSVMMIFLARHLFYMRTATFLVCGSVKMRFYIFLISDMLAGLVSVPLMLLLGLFASEHYEKAMEILSRAKFWAVIIGIFLLSYGYIYWRKKHPKKAIEPTNADCQ